MDGYNKTDYHFDRFDEVVENDQGRIECLHFVRMELHPVHSSLLEDKDITRSIEYALEYSCPVKVYIENGLTCFFSQHRSPSRTR